MEKGADPFLSNKQVRSPSSVDVHVVVVTFLTSTPGKDSMVFESTVCWLVSFACYCIHDNVLGVHIFIFSHSHFHATK